MTLLLDLTLKVSVVLLLALAATSALRRRSAAMRHGILAAAIVCAAATPVLQRVVPSWHAGLGVFPPPASVGDAHTAARGLGTSLTLSAGAADAAVGDRSAAARRLLAVVWLGGVFVSLFTLLAGLLRLAVLAAGSERVLDARWTVPLEGISQRYRLFRPVVILQSDHPTLLVTWGLGRPRVILPRAARQWSDERIRIVLCHELAHIRRRDWALQMTAEVLRSIYWFNPLAWMARTRLRQESEYACDDAVLGEGVKAPEYATHLLDLARAVLTSRASHLADSTALAFARPSTLERRIRAMLNARLNRRPFSRAASAATALAWLGVAGAIAGFGTTARTSALSFAAPPVTVVPQSILDRTNGGARGRRGAGDPAVGVVVGAQAGAFATLSGTISDQLGGLLPGVTISLTNPSTQTKYEIRSGRNGEFEFAGVQAGSYQLQATLPGFATLRGSVEVGAGDNTRTALRMDVGSLQETISVTGSRSAPSVVTGDTAPRAYPAGRGAAPACTAPIAGGIGGNIKQPAKTRDVRPIYPAGAQSAGIAGTVMLKATVGADGYVKDVQVQGDPNAELAASAVAAVRGWEFTATLLNCVPIDVQMSVAISFLLGQ